MNVLIIYASNSGNTMFVAERIGEALREHKLEVTVENVSQARAEQLKEYDLVILGSCTWLRQGVEGQLMEQFYMFAEKLKNHTHFSQKPFAVFALGRHEYTKFCAAADELERLVEEVGGILAIPSLRVDGFPQNQIATFRDWVNDLVNNIRPQNKGGKRIIPITS